MAGCADKELAKEVAALRAEVASTKIEKDAKFAELVAELAKAREDNQRVEKQLDALSKNNADFDKTTERLDKLVEALPLPQLIVWKDLGLITCKQMDIKETDSVGWLTVTPGRLSFSDGAGSSLNATAKGVLVESKDGYRAAMLSYDGTAEVVTFSPDSAYVKMVTTSQITGLKVGYKEDDPNHGFLGRLSKTGKVALRIDGAQTNLFANAAELSLSKADKDLVRLSIAKRGARLDFYDEVGSNSKISLSLNQENGEPGVVVMGATQCDILVPKYDNPKSEK